MAVQAQYGGLAGVPAACLPHSNAMAAEEAEAQMRAMQDYGALLSAVAAAAAANNGYNCAAVVSGTQSELTCNGGGGGGGVLASRKRDREVEQYMSSSSALLPIPGMANAVVPAPAADAVTAAGRLVESAMTSTSGRRAASSSSIADALVSEMYQHNNEIDAIVRVECERLHAGLELARKRQCQSLVRAASAAAARRLWEKEAELEATRRRAASLEERLRQEAAESQAWCSLARSNEADAAGLRATLDQLLRAAPAPAPAPIEGFGDSDPAALAAANDAQSCYLAGKDASEDDAAGSPAGKWACKCCNEREASVLLLPCRHLCLCKACEPKLDSCPLCLAAKNASIHVATN